ncbi:hypothetical protein MRX96_052695 [Rhipicephalus microplus]
MKLFTKKRGARQEPLWADVETDGSAGNATARKTVLEGKEPHDPKYPNTGSCTVSGGSALPPHTPSPPTGNTTAGLGADRADEPEVVHQPEEQPVPPPSLYTGAEDHQRDSGTMCSDLFTVETYYSFLSRVVTVSFLCT